MFFIDLKIEKQRGCLILDSLNLFNLLILNILRRKRGSNLLPNIFQIQYVINMSKP